MSPDIAKFPVGDRIASVRRPLPKEETVMMDTFSRKLPLMGVFGWNEIGNRLICFLSLTEGNTGMLIFKGWHISSFLPPLLPSFFVPYYAFFLSLPPSFNRFFFFWSQHLFHPWHKICDALKKKETLTLLITGHSGIWGLYNQLLLPRSPRILQSRLSDLNGHLCFQ